MEPQADSGRNRPKRKYLIRKVSAAEPAFSKGRYEMIREAAEARARTRGSGGDVGQDWLCAEAEVEARLGRTRPF